jgi:hypothetical protein
MGVMGAAGGTLIPPLSCCKPDNDMLLRIHGVDTQ